MNEFERTRDANEGIALPGVSPKDAVLLVVGYSFPQGTLDNIITRDLHDRDGFELIYWSPNGVWLCYRVNNAQVMDIEQRSRVMLDVIAWLRDVVRL